MAIADKDYNIIPNSSQSARKDDNSIDDDIFGSASGIFELEDDAEEVLWDKLIQCVIEGKVIPVIGAELLEVDETDVNKYIIDGLAQFLKISEAKMPRSFSELVYSKEYKEKFNNRDLIYYQVNNICAKKEFSVSSLLKKILSIPQFPFVITTNYSPIVEQAMREIWKDELRVMRFNNNPMENDDIKTGADLRKPTVYYMFGKVCRGVKQYVLTDTDMLDFVSSWLSNDNKVRPKNLCNELKDKYLLVLGNNYNNWLFRFIWYSIRKADLGNGMLAYNTLDEQLVNFLNRTDTFVKGNISEVVHQIESRLKRKRAENEKTKFGQYKDDMDIFISYSRSDKEIAEKLYDALTKKGKQVWFDKYNITAGGDFQDEIKKAIRTTKYFVPIFTENITLEKNHSHIYRKEWDIALDVAKTMGRTFIIPIAENGFEFYKSAIKDEMLQRNAVFFSKDDDIEIIAEKIIHSINQD